MPGQPVSVKVDNAPNVHAELALDPETTQRWLHGHFQLVARGHRVGNWDDLVSLSVVRSWLPDLAASDARRWDERIAGLDPCEANRFLMDLCYGDGPVLESSAAVRTFDISHVGATAFDQVTVLLADPSPSEQWLMWGFGGTAAKPLAVECVSLQHGELSHLSIAIAEQIDRSQRSLDPSEPPTRF
jgi:hypothetical protein